MGGLARHPRLKAGDPGIHEGCLREFYERESERVVHTADVITLLHHGREAGRVGVEQVDGDQHVALDIT